MRLNRQQRNCPTLAAELMVALRTITITQRAAQAVIAIVLALQTNHLRGLARRVSSALTLLVSPPFTIHVTRTRMVTANTTRTMRIGQTVILTMATPAVVTRTRTLLAHPIRRQHLVRTVRSIWAGQAQAGRQVASAMVMTMH